MAEIQHLENREEVYNVPDNRANVPEDVRTVPRRRISWGAVWGGFMVALGVGALLVFFGLFIDFAAFNPATGSHAGFVAWSWAWGWFTAFVSLYAGGWAAARLRSAEQPQSGSMHGLVTWGLTTLWTVGFLLWAAWSTISAAISSLGGLVATAAVPAGAPSVPAGTGPAIGSFGWQLAFLIWIAIGIAALGAWIGGKRGEHVAARA